MAKGLPAIALRWSLRDIDTIGNDVEEFRFLREPTYTDEELWALVLDLEDEMCAKGIDQRRRSFLLPVKAMERLGYASFSLSSNNSPLLFNRIQSIQRTLYRDKDVAVGGIHGGAFMFRAIATLVYVPIIFGTVQIDPFAYCDLSSKQIEWLRRTEGQERKYLVNFCNLFDLAACINPMSGYREVSDRVVSHLRLSAMQTQAAGAALCAAFDERGAIQSSLIAAELAMKAGLLNVGMLNKELRALGHDFEKMVRALNRVYPSLKTEEALGHVKKLPKLVTNRYSPEQPGRIQTGEIVMASQAIIGEVARLLTEGSLLESLVLE